MAAISKIEWTDATWNPVVGCTKVSPGCAHCYAETMAFRLRGMALADIAAGRDPGRKRHYIDAVDDSGRWTGKLIFAPEALSDPLRWARPRMIFVNSMSDLFHESLSDEAIAAVMAAIVLAGQHTFQVLTKRSDRMRRLMGRLSVDRCFEAAVNAGLGLPGNANRKRAARMMQSIGRDPYAETGWPPQNLWLGVSVENQQTADERIPHLVATPAAVRMVSAEPLLGPIDFLKFCHDIDFLASLDLDWIIVGGESGLGEHIRPMHPDWARSIRDQCQAAGVPFFFKQWGEWRPTNSSLPINGRDTRRGLVGDGESEMIVYRVGKHAAGRLLDGRTWDEFPKAFTGSSSLSEVK